ncbi:MAG: glycoside hydrolase family 3 [Desulfuromonadales bacterium]|nr:glycoside hydrolase family 3 [Desulfuromonadales bacterium]MBN2792519.1 glycoside hydrolase family 3 [Desulfuromonadales bacterium]
MKLWLSLMILLFSALPVRADELVDAAPTLEQQIGQLLVVGFRGSELAADHWVMEAVRRGILGGVVLFDKDLQYPGSPRNITSSLQLKTLTRQLQQAADQLLLIAVDQEGGQVVRLNSADGFPQTPSHMQLGRLNDLAATTAAAQTIAATLADHGINLNLGPVIDLCSNSGNPVIYRYQRCFSADPQIVSAHAAAWIRAHQRCNVLTALKHFPGHGSSLTDSHLGFSDISETWSSAELIPYRQLIDQGLADMIMTAHVFNCNLDANAPATLSPQILQELLREQLGFEGPILSDDLQMAAIRDNYSFAESIKAALNAGVDLLLFGNNIIYDEKIVERSIRVIKDLIAAGELNAEQVERSYCRIQQLTQRLINSSAE